MSSGAYLEMLDEEWLMSNGIPPEMARDLVKRDRRKIDREDKWLLSIMKAWGHGD